MKRALLALLATIVGTFWVVTWKVSPNPVAGNTPSPTPTPGDTTPAPTPATATYTGQDVQTFYGDVQVQIVVTNHKIVDVKFPNLPIDRARSQEISQYAAPILHDEVIQAQSSNVDIVSGATFTSEGFIQSLQDAMHQAGLNG